MPIIKLTKGELKRQRDGLRQYNRYLPTLLLKKQQLQTEILRQNTLLREKEKIEGAKTLEAEQWAGLLTDTAVDIKPYIRPSKVETVARNIAGVDVSFFDKVEFAAADYDLFLEPLWVDGAIEQLRAIVVLRQEIEVLQKGVTILRRELRTTSQRVNLFEKVKIPEAEDAIRRIKIFVGDQMTNAVGRSKIAKKKIDERLAIEVLI